MFRSRLFYYYAAVLLTFGLGVVDTISAVARPIHRNFALDFIFSHRFNLLSRGVVLTFGFFLILVAYGLWLRSRSAWRAAMVLAILSLIGHLLKGPDYDEALYSLSVVGLLWGTQGMYRKPADPASLRRAIGLVVMSFGSLILYSLLGFFFLDLRNFGQDFTLSQALAHSLRLAFFFGDPSLVPHAFFARVFLGSIESMALFTWCFGIYALLRPALERLHRHPSEHDRALGLVRRCGIDHTDYFKLYWDKRFFFTEDGAGFLSYKLAEPNAVVLADPVAPTETDRQETITQFLVYAERHGWRVAFQNVPESSLSMYDALGWEHLKVGEEAVVCLGNLDLELPDYKEFRTAMRRLEKEGCAVHQYRPPLSDALLTRLQEVSDEWLSLPNRSERVFSQGCFDRSSLRDCPVATVENEAGEIFAFISLVEGYEAGVVALDLLRRRTRVPSGTIDALLMQTMLDRREQGLNEFSLGLAPLAGVGEGGLPEKTLRALYENYPGFSYKGLREFKAKFQPDWRSRYLVFERRRQLPGIGLAILQVSKMPAGGR